jgi:hypothetical protein
MLSSFSLFMLTASQRDFLFESVFPLVSFFVICSNVALKQVNDNYDSIGNLAQTRDLVDPGYNRQIEDLQ